MTNTCNPTPGERFTLPNGVPVQAAPSSLPGMVSELHSPGRWARWAVDDAGRLWMIGALMGKKHRLYPTPWALADLHAGDLAGENKTR